MTTGKSHAPTLILLAGGIAMTLALGTRHTFGLYLQPVTADLGWARQTFAFALALQNLETSVAAAERVFALVDAPPVVREPDVPSPMPRDSGMTSPNRKPVWCARVDAISTTSSLSRPRMRKP